MHLMVASPFYDFQLIDAINNALQDPNTSLANRDLLESLLKCLQTLLNAL